MLKRLHLLLLPSAVVHWAVLLSERDTLIADEVQLESVLVYVRYMTKGARCERQVYV